MPNLSPTTTDSPAPDELGYFYDSIHGRISLHELPQKFHPALKAALASPTLNRLRRISQLGHTSVSFFSATQTRFSHAVGTMLLMNKLYLHVRGRSHDGDWLHKVFDEMSHPFGNHISTFGTPDSMIHCHLLLAALYQDAGELPFQKVTSLYFVPHDEEVVALANTLACSSVKGWKSKNIFTLLALEDDMMKNSELKSGFNGYSLKFLSYLITGDCPPKLEDGSPALAIPALRQLVDGVIDADRLDYVYRDASVTIGSLSHPNAVLESILEYSPNSVVVSDPRPVTDFLSTRMRLWTFVYTAADVRFRQALLKNVLDGRLVSDITKKAFDAKELGDLCLNPTLEHREFLKLDDACLENKLHTLKSLDLLKGYRKVALELLLKGTLDYECHMLKRIESKFDEHLKQSLPDRLFFDLLRDHGDLQLFRNNSIFVRPPLTSRKTGDVPLEQTAGALGPIFSAKNSAMLVADSFFLFVPSGAFSTEGTTKLESYWAETDKEIEEKTIYSHTAWEDARRSLTVPADTRGTFHNGGRIISISYCSKDFPIAVRVVRELFARKKPYRMYLRPLDGIGGTPAENSIELIKEAGAVIMLVSKNYVEKWVDRASYIAMEISAIGRISDRIPVVPLGVDNRAELATVTGWEWREIHEGWNGQELVIPDACTLRDANEVTLKETVSQALKRIER